MSILFLPENEPGRTGIWNLINLLQRTLSYFNKTSIGYLRIQLPDSNLILRACSFSLILLLHCLFSLDAWSQEADTLQAKPAPDSLALTPPPADSLGPSPLQLALTDSLGANQQQPPSQNNSGSSSGLSDPVQFSASELYVIAHPGRKSGSGIRLDRKTHSPFGDN